MHFPRHLIGLLACCGSIIVVVKCSAAGSIPARLPLPTSSNSSSSGIYVNLTSYSPHPLNTSALDSYHRSDLIDPLSTILPYSFSVPNTRTYLRLGFGFPRRRLDPMSMGGLIAVMQHEIERGIQRDGVDFAPGVDALAEVQRIGCSLGDGFSFVMHNNYEYGELFFTWRQAQNVVEGLRLFLIVGERFYATEFNFWDGPRFLRFPLGGGGILVDRDEGEVAEQKGRL